MSEFRFLCPACGQKILGDTDFSGRQIACPTCQNTLTIPAATSAAPAPIAQPAVAAVAAGNAPPLPPMAPAAQRAFSPSPSPSPSPLPKPQDGTPSRYSALAIASLICAAFVIPGFIPGIICGHMAKARMRKDVFLEGEKMANAGLAISYSVLAAILVCALTGLGVRWHFHPVQTVRDSADAPAARQSRVVDEVVIGETEEDHELDGQIQNPTQVGPKAGRSAQRGGSFGYTMKVLPHEPMSLVCRYWGSQGKGHVFDLAVNEQIIATQTLNYNAREKFFDVEYKIPASLTRGKTEVKVEFQAHPSMTAGAVFGCQMLRR